MSTVKKQQVENNIRTWYKSKYADDPLWDTIRPDANFYRLVGVLVTAEEDVYEYLFSNGGDSIIRERIFEELATRMDVNYDVVYNMMLEY